MTPDTEALVKRLQTIAETKAQLNKEAGRKGKLWTKEQEIEWKAAAKIAEQAREIDNLSFTRDGLKSEVGYLEGKVFRTERILAERDAELARARQIIQPFADTSSEWEGEPDSLHVFLEWNDEKTPVPSIPVADFRAARKFLEDTDG